MFHEIRITIAASLSLASGAALALGGTPDVEKVVVHAQARFDFDRAEVHPEDAANILAELGKLGKVTWQTVEATGHTDSIGPDDYNQGLSERRAIAVRDFLVSKGVERNMVATVGKSKAEPVADNSTAQGRAQNRRTDVTFEGVRTAAN